METAAVEHRYPRIVGLVPQGKRGPSDRWFELLVTGRDEIGGMAKLTTILAQHSVSLAPSGGYYLTAPNDFVWTTFVSFASSKSPLEKVVGDVRRLDFVTEAHAVEVSGAALDKFLFPVLINGKHRGIIMSLSPLLRGEQRLMEILGSGGAALMFEEGKAYAMESMAQLREAVPDLEPTEFLNTVVAWARTAGWGISMFDTTKLTSEGTVGVTVREPPNSLTNGRKESHFLDGVVAGVVEFVYSRRVKLTSSQYDEHSRSLRLSLKVE